MWKSVWLNLGVIEQIDMHLMSIIGSWLIEELYYKTSTSWTGLVERLSEFMGG